MKTTESKCWVTRWPEVVRVFCGGYQWTFNARPDGKQDHEDYRYPYFSFEYNKVHRDTTRAAGKGYLHKRAFGAHRTETDQD